MKLVLASGSATRASMLESAGVSFAVDPANVDEASLKEALVAESAPPRDIADALADLKARTVAMRHPGDRVLGSDQLLVCEGKLFTKARTRADAAATLEALSGKDHHLVSAAVIYEAMQPVWRTVDIVKMTVRPLSESFIEKYLDTIGEAAFMSVGAYQIEGRGAQLFTKVAGSHFSVLGMPLLPLLDYLRRVGALEV